METVGKQPKASRPLGELKWRTWAELDASVIDLSIRRVCRYAFTPLIDDSDDEEIEEFIASTNIGTTNALECLNCALMRFP